MPAIRRCWMDTAAHLCASAAPRWALLLRRRIRSRCPGQVVRDLQRDVSRDPSSDAGRSAVPKMKDAFIEQDHCRDDRNRLADGSDPEKRVRAHGLRGGNVCMTDTPRG